MTLKVIRLLGAGGFGRVELVEDTNGVQSARKTFSVAQNLAPNLLDNVRKRFVREAKTQSGLQHRNIVPVTPTGLHDNPPWYLMPIADSTLQDDIAQDRTLDGNYLVALADMVAALTEMHQMKIYHRDLKPQNVLRFADSAAPGFRYAVSDFGLVALSETRLSTLTTTGMAKGADYFTAPEVTADLRNAGPQSDIYSLGCILHEMVGQGPRVPCHEIKDAGPFGPVMRTATRTDPGRRFPSVKSFLDAVLSASTGFAQPHAQEAADFAAKIDSGEALDEGSWKALVEYVEDHVGTSDASAILMRLRLNQIADLCQRFGPYADRLGLIYAEWVATGNFAFERCDSLANNLELFVLACGFETKVECLMALLRLGTSHNRWYVEGVFMRLCGPQMDSDLARRLAVEFRATGDRLCQYIAHLELSIRRSRADLHPMLVQVLTEVCP